jgi:pre-mRNA cleavage complex 2 protein Pcf11
VNEKTREKMYNLRTTWNDVFSQTKLYALDVKVNCIDPNWPITAKVVPNRSPAIHVNPNFFNRQSNAGVTDMQQQLRDKERELLELQKKKLELELAATKKRIEEQEKQLNLQTESVKVSFE